MLDCSPERAWQYHEARLINDADFSTCNLPVLNEGTTVIFNHLRDTELLLVPKEDYVIGSATYDNELLVIRGVNGTLLTAEHATFHRRTLKSGTVSLKEPDTGTAALGLVVAEATQNDAIIAVGRQTGDANNDPEHPFKEKIEEIVSYPISRAHLALHGMLRAHAEYIDDKRGFAVHIGIGDNPSPATKALADFLLEAAKDYDLRAGINQTHLRFNNKAQKPRLNDDGTVETRVFKGGGDTTRAYSEKFVNMLGRGDSFAALQIELSDVLRYHPETPVAAPIEFPTHKDRKIGACLGYLFVRSAAESVAKL